ncbi:MAG: hypothetical protein HY884_10155 [Deltaproteobacteria bacterium]|nr:hypothetical protein [Deltaproteobacteria bacterium]
MNRSVYLVFLLGFYLPFEDFILKWFPMPEKAYLILRQAPDALVLSLALVIFLKSVFESRLSVVSKKSSFFLLMFMGFALLTVVINNSSLITAVLSLKALLRYVFLVYILCWIKPSEKQALAFIKVVIALAFVEATIGNLQYIGGDAVLEFFRPRELSGEMGIAFTTVTGDEVFGTMAYTISYASFLLIGLVFLFVFGTRVGLGTAAIGAGAAYLFAAILFSGSRAAFLSAIIAGGLYIFFKRGIRVVFYLTPGILVLLFVLLYADKGNTSRDFLFFLSPQYLDNLESQRLGMVRIFLDYLTSADRHLLYGLSPDKQFLTDYLAMNYRMPYLFSEKMLKAFEDVYWLALLFYYGIIGLSFFALTLYYLYKKLMAFNLLADVDGFRKDALLACRILMLLLIPLNLVNQTFEVRQFSFYLWAFMGLTFSVLSQPNGKGTVLKR